MNITFTRFKLEIPKTNFLSVLSRKYPELTFNILSLLPLNNKVGSCSLQIKGKSLLHYRKDIIEKIEHFKLNFIILSNIPGYILLNLQIEDPWILQTIIKIELMIHYPLQIKNGIIYFQIISDRNKIDNLFSEFENNKIDFMLGEISNYRPTSLLTPKQDSILIDALEKGYFDIPRKISLSEIANQYKISPSALSETFRRINKRLALDYQKRKTEHQNINQ